MKGMLDTSVLVGRIPEDVLESIEGYSASMIVRAELRRGLARFRSMTGGERRARVREQLIDALDSLGGFWEAFGIPESDAYAELVADPETAARTKDALIAAHAVSRDVPLITADRGFSRFPALELITLSS